MKINIMRYYIAAFALACALNNFLLAQDDNALSGQISNLDIQAGLDGDSGEAGFQITGTLEIPNKEPKDPFLYTTSVSGAISIGPGLAKETWDVSISRLRGQWNDLEIYISANTFDPNLDVQFAKPDLPFFLSIQATQDPEIRLVKIIVDKSSASLSTTSGFVLKVSNLIKTKSPFVSYTPLVVNAEDAASFTGSYTITSEDPLYIQPVQIGKSVSITPKETTETLGYPIKRSQKSKVLVLGPDYKTTFAIYPEQPDQYKNSFNEFLLTSEFDSKIQVVKMKLEGVAEFKHPEGGRIPVLGGDVGLVSYKLGNDKSSLVFQNGAYYIVSDSPGNISVEIDFSCRIKDEINQKSVNVIVANSTIRPIILKGWSKESSFEIFPLGDVQIVGESARGFLKPQGGFSLVWKSKTPKESGKVFYSVQGKSQISLGSGRLSQVLWMDYQVMQGEVSSLNFEILGQGEILKVDGADIRSWKILPVENSTNRKMIVETRRPIKGDYQLRIVSQQTLPAFPLNIEPLKLVPSGALAYGGYIRVHNQGAVKIEIKDPLNLTQISPERFPRLSGFPKPNGNQVFAYRFSGSDFEYKIQADTIIPEVSLSQLTVHTLGNTAQSIDSLIELDIREAPLREFTLNLPNNYVLTQVQGNYVADYFLDNDDPLSQKLKLVFSQPVSGRWIGQFQLSRNKQLDIQDWEVPQILSPVAKTSRGHIGVAVDPGLRVSTSDSMGVTEIAAAFFPKKVEGLALAFRLRDFDWSLKLQIDELEQSLQVDTLQLFSIGDGIIYGSSLLNYLVSGAPVNSFEVLLSDDYSNLEFVGKGIRNWKKTDGGYEVFLENPVFGTYSLLATYDLKLEKDEAKTYPFQGVHPVRAKNNQGYVLFISHYQVDLGAIGSGGRSNVVSIEPAEIPSEFRLIYDAPLVDSYLYSSYPFNLDLEVKQLERGDSLQMLVDRIEVKTEVSSDGQSVSLAEYFVKNKSNSHFVFNLPEGLELWDVKVDGDSVVPVSDNGSILVPIKVKPNSNELIRIAVRTAYTPDDNKKMVLKLPVIESSALVTRWTVQSSDGKFIKYHAKESGLTPDFIKKRQRGYNVIRVFLRGRNSVSENFYLGLGLVFGSLIFLLVFSELRRAFKIWKWVPVKWVSFAGVLMAVVSFLAAMNPASNLHNRSAGSSALEFSIPVSEPKAENEITISIVDKLGFAASCPAVLLILFGMILLFASRRYNSNAYRFLLLSIGWAFVIGGALTQYNGLPLFIAVIVLICIIHLLVPILRITTSEPGLNGDSGDDPQPTTQGGSESSNPNGDRPKRDDHSGGIPSALGAILIGAYVALSGFHIDAAEQIQSPSQNGQALSQNAVLENSISRQVVSPPVKIESIKQNIKIEDKFLFSDTQLSWRAKSGETIQILGKEAIFQSLHFNAKDGIRLVPSSSNEAGGIQLYAEKNGLFKIDIEYKVQLQKGNNQTSAYLLTPAAMSHLVQIDFGTEDVEISADTLISSELNTGQKGHFQYNLVLSPQENPRLSWQPRRRDARSEKAVYFAELKHLFVPSAGVIDGRHMATVRPAQGVVSQLVFDVDKTLTIVDVPSANVKSWRFDPDTRKFTVDLLNPQTGVFSIVFLSQSGSGTLPYDKEVGLVHLPGAASELGNVGVSAPNEVQLDSVEASGMATLSLEDYQFPDFGKMSFPQSTLRRAYQYSGQEGSLDLSVSPIEPDVRADTRMTLSLGEDRTLLAVQINISVARSGIFKLQFPLPKGLEMESLTGQYVSHWTQNLVQDEEVITVHLVAKTLGTSQIQMNLVGQGMLDATNLSAPSIQFDETTKQTGTLIITPELGVRLYPESQSGVLQQDASSVGVSQKGALVFNLLQKDWDLSFSVEKDNAWLQSVLLQKVTFREGLVKTGSDVVVTIENAGVDSLQVGLPDNAESVDIEGKNIVDFVKSNQSAGGKTTWDIRFERRLIGQVPLKIRYQQPILSTVDQWPLDIVEIYNQNLFKVWVSYKSEGRLRVESVEENQGFQPADWASIPGNLRGQKGNPDGFVRVLRKVNDTASLNLQVLRNEVEKVLPARILSTKLMSVMSSGGEMLTLVELRLDPGEERQLTVKLPAQSKFWLGYINDKSIWPWKDGEKLLLPIEKNPGEQTDSVCKFIYSSRFAGAEIKGGTFDLYGPGFNLPLEQIKWQVFLPKDMEIIEADGNLDLIEVQTQMNAKGLDLKKLSSYIDNEGQFMKEQNRKAIQLLNTGNEMLISGDNYKAQRAFEDAINFSQSDPTFNEDARVQFQNIRNQQANIALNARLNNVYFNNTVASPQVDYNSLTQNQIDQLMEATSEEDRQAIERLAERLVRQQEAAIARPASIYATFPAMGKSWQLRRSHLVEINKPLAVEIKIRRDNEGYSWNKTVAVTLIAIMASSIFFIFSGWIIKRGSKTLTT